MATLLTDIVGYWRLDEAASAMRVDAVSANNLSDNGTVGSGTGVLNTDGTFNGSSQYLTVADAQELRLAGSKSFSVWAKLSSKSADGTVFGKWVSTSNKFEYILQYIHADDRFEFVASMTGAGTSNYVVKANNFGSPSTATWYHVSCGYDHQNNLIFIAVNAGTRNTTSTSGSPGGNVANFTVGRNDDGTQQYWDGEIDELGMWNRVLTTTEATNLYNSGAGLAYPFGLLPSPIWFEG
jgi:hypothetical protein